MKPFFKGGLVSGMVALLLGSGLISLGACSASQGTSAMVPSSAATAQRSSAAGLATLKTHNVMPRNLRDLYVADNGTGAIDVLRNKSYRDIGVISYGIDQPVDLFLDRKGNLYVANYSGGNISEYAPGNLGAPNFVYSKNMVNPKGVTTDAHGNVFEADANGTVNEYFQGSKGLIASCSAPYGIQSLNGIAVDSSGDVFVDSQFSGVYTAIEEYPGGLKGCNAQVRDGVGALGHGFALDQNNNLLVAAGGQVLKFSSPYYSPAGSIGSGFSNAVSVTLNKKNTIAFVADSANGTVTLVSYPDGTNLMVLGTQNGLADPVAAVDWPNAVY